MIIQPLIRIDGPPLPLGYEDVAEYLEQLRAGHVLRDEPYLILSKTTITKRTREYPFRLWLKRTKSNWIVRVCYPAGEAGTSLRSRFAENQHEYGYELDSALAHYRKETENPGR